jgi:hypothetical protein
MTEYVIVRPPKHANVLTQYVCYDDCMSNYINHARTFFSYGEAVHHKRQLNEDYPEEFVVIHKPAM